MTTRIATRTLWALLLGLPLLLKPLEARAQTGSSAALTESDSTLIRVRATAVDALPGSPQTFFSTGMREQALLLRDLLAEADAYLSTSLGLDVEFSLAVLNEADWAGVWPFPYGLPYLSLGKPWTAVMPGDPEASVLYAGFAEMLGPARAADMVDNIGFHEVGHVYVSECVYDGRVAGAPPLRWLDEYLATYLAYAFLRALAPERAAIWDDFVEATTSATDPTFTSLDDFEAEYNGYLASEQGVENYSWYQAVFTRHAARVHEELGLDFVERVRDRLGETAPSTWTTASVLALFEEIAPGLGRWAESP